MPFRTDRHAPKFHGEAETLLQFFDDLQELAKAAQISDKEKIEYVFRYVDARFVESWKTRPEAKGSDFAAFKKAIIERYYKGLTGDRRFTVGDLEKLCEKWAAKVGRTQLEHGTYIAEFDRITTYLLDNDRLWEKDQSQAFLKGLDYDLRHRVRAQLQIKYPDIHSLDHYPLAHVQEATEWELEGTETGTTTSTFASTSSTIAPVVKQEYVDQMQFAQYMQAQQQQMFALTQAMQSFANNRTPLPVLPPPNTFAQPYVAPNVPTYPNNIPTAPYAPQQGYVRDGPPRCAFCSETSHYVRECPRAQTAVREGRCVRNGTNRLVLPDGSELPMGYGRNLGDRLDAFYRENPTRVPQPLPPLTNATRDTPPHITAAMLGITDSYIIELEVEPTSEVVEAMMVEERSRMVEESDSEDEAQQQSIDALMATVQALQFERDKKRTGNPNRSRVLGSEAKVGPPRGSRPNEPITRKVVPKPPIAIDDADLATYPARLEEIPEAFVPKAPPLPAQVVLTVPPAPPIQNRYGSNRPNLPSQVPQYKYSTPIEDSKIVDIVVNRLLNQNIMISARELFSTTPDVRKHIKELIATKRILTPTEPVMPIEVFLNHVTWEKYENKVVAEHSIPLRVVHPSFPGGHTAECILDSGAQIIAMRKDVWQRMELALNPDLIMVMESANASKEQTYGLVKNCRVSFGPVELVLQIQVVLNAPFEVLLGRPFLCLAEANTKDFRDGSQEITLQDPNSGERVCLTTAARPPPEDRTSSGFQ